MAYTLKTVRTCTGKVVKVKIPDYWLVEYIPLRSKGKARSYYATGKATFPRRDDARNYVRYLRRKYGACKEHVNADKYIRCTAFSQ